MPSEDERIVRLETKVEYLEKHLDEVHGAIEAVDRKLTDLTVNFEKRFARLAALVVAGGAAGAGAGELLKLLL